MSFSNIRNTSCVSISEMSSNSIIVILSIASELNPNYLNNGKDLTHNILGMY